MEVFAGKVFAQPQEDHWLLGFADSEFDTENYLILQRAFEFDAQDHAQGMATYYLEIDDQANSLYGGVSRAVLHPDRIELEFTEEGRGVLGIDEALTIRFDPAVVRWDVLADIAEKVLGIILEVHPP